MENQSSIRQAKEIFAELNKASKIVLITHKNPDGDALGSSLGLYHFLKEKGIACKAVVPNEFPPFLNWMPGSNDLLVYDNDPENVGQLIEDADLIICLDLNHPSRVGELHKHIGKNECTKVIIDHHLEPSDMAKYFYWDHHASSTAELVYDFIKDIKETKAINKDCAYALYTGLVTDTGSFQFPATSPNVHAIAAELLKLEIDFNMVHREIYQSFSETRVRFWGHCLSKKMKLYPEHKTAIIIVSKKDVAEFKVERADMEGLVNQPLQMGHINMAVLMVDKDDMRKFSFRSKGNMDVNVLARKYFGGGGHKNAAGGHSYKGLGQNIDLLEKILPEFSDELNNAV